MRVALLGLGLLALGLALGPWACAPKAPTPLAPNISADQAYVDVNAPVEDVWQALHALLLEDLTSLELKDTQRGLFATAFVRAEGQDPSLYVRWIGTIHPTPSGTRVGVTQNLRVRDPQTGRLIVKTGSLAEAQRFLRRLLSALKRP